jgi:hypothetical protein
MRNVLIGFAYAVALMTLLIVGVGSLVLLPADATTAVVGFGAAALLVVVLVLAHASARRVVAVGHGVPAGPADSEGRVALGVLVLSAAMVVAFGVWGVALAALLLLAGSFALPDGRPRTALFAVGSVLALCALALLSLVVALV